MPFCLLLLLLQPRQEVAFPTAAAGVSSGGGGERTFGRASGGDATEGDVVAVCISGAARGPVSALLAASALREHFILPAMSGRASFTVFAWLEDDDAELLLERELGQATYPWWGAIPGQPNGGGWPMLSRRRALRDFAASLPEHLRQPTDRLSDRGVALRAETDSARDGESAGMRLNTLRMLRKIGAAEWLRAHAETALGFPRATLVLRTRPDLALLAPLPLPPPIRSAPAPTPAPSLLLLPWRCVEAGLAFDQLFLFAPNTPAAELIESALGSALAAAAAGRDIYPEAFLWHHLTAGPLPEKPHRSGGAAAFAPQVWPATFRAALLTDAAGEPTSPSAAAPTMITFRDPFDKLRADFGGSGCAFPPPLTPAERQ